MKIQTLSFAVVIAAGITIIYGCNQSDSNKSANADRKGVTTKCYQAVYEQDTVTLSYDQKGTVISDGRLTFRYGDGKLDDGTLKGLMKGDTLIGEYSFKSHDGRWYRNPVAFLAKDNKLVLGVGKFEVAWGRTYFKKNEPIDYDKGRFVFDEMQCE